ncbi:uncharacterized protein LOC132722936 [Ruditapes philippinarum]|uniref:uncharacterized protein LOC132722936 n=1 Tax=Ruditapes philippinarum TaxID=129788 RepID=UPI00295B3E16|nr:uncharacterized protein LOC132722936 [Ruditapes philippinarum]
MANYYVKTAFLVIIFTKSIASTSISAGCSYEHISTKFSDCIWNVTALNSFNEAIEGFFHSDTLVTEDDLLSTLTSKCGDESYMKKYSFCAQRCVENCPQLTYVVTQYIKQDVAVFCENGEPSEWLATVLQSTYRYNKQCIDYGAGDNRVLEIVQQCVDEADFLNHFSDLIVSYAVSTLQSDISNWFRCMLDNAPSFPDYDGDGILDCGSTWQDVVVMLALRISAFNQLGMTINQEIIAELKDIKNGS